MGNHEKVNRERLDIIEERFESNIGYQEHLARYNFVKELVKDKFILDLGCGIGEGTSLLSSVARKVIGTEIDKNRLIKAQNYFKNDNIDYLVADGCDLSFKDKTFDAVVSLEVIEHLKDQDNFLSEIKRVLKEGGTAIVSTPNRELIKIQGSGPNPDHVKELTFREFKKLILKHFKNAEFYGQKRGRGIEGIGRAIHYFVRTIDIFKIRRLFPKRYKANIYNKIAKATGAKDKSDIFADDVKISKSRVHRARNIIMVSKK